MVSRIWRFVFVQQQSETAMTAVEFPPMQKGASFQPHAVSKNHKAQNSIANRRRGPENRNDTAANGSRRAATR